METIYFKKPTEQSYFQRGHGSPELEEGPGARSGCSVTLLYFAYGSNMDLNQMDFRCPDAQALETVRLEGYRLAFRSNGGNRGVATILPDPDSHVDGVLAISDIYPQLVGKMNHLEQTEPLSRSGIIGVSWSSIGGEAAGLLNENHLAADGIDNVIKVLEELEDEKLQELDFIELNACAGGCVGGIFAAENG